MPKIKPMTEEQLRAIDPSELEDKEITWVNGETKHQAKVIYDYDQGLSILNSKDPEDCLTGIHGPGYKSNRSNYNSKKYHLLLTASIILIKKGLYDIIEWYILAEEIKPIIGSTSCSFS